MLRKLRLVVMAVVLSVVNASAQDGSLELRARVAALSPSRITLDFSLLNSASVPLDFFAADLPWATRRSLMLVPVTNDSEAQRIAEALYVDDPKPGQVTVKARDQLSGTVDLSRRPKSV